MVEDPYGEQPVLVSPLARTRKTIDSITLFPTFSPEPLGSHSEPLGAAPMLTRAKLNCKRNERKRKMLGGTENTRNSNRSAVALK